MEPDKKEIMKGKKVNGWMTELSKLFTWFINTGICGFSSLRNMNMVSLTEGIIITIISKYKEQ